jgi:hypothetical protein
LRLPRSKRGKVLLVLAVLLLGGLYVAAYSHARERHWIVHRSGYAGGNTATHSMAPGDFGTGFNPEHQRASAVYLIFLPLTLVEDVYWHWRHPVGSPWPYANTPSAR